MGCCQAKETRRSPWLAPGLWPPRAAQQTSAHTTHKNGARSKTPARQRTCCFGCGFLGASGGAFGGLGEASWILGYKGLLATDNASPHDHRTTPRGVGKDFGVVGGIWGELDVLDRPRRAGLAALVSQPGDWTGEPQTFQPPLPHPPESPIHPPPHAKHTATPCGWPCPVFFRHTGHLSPLSHHTPSPSVPSSHPSRLFFPHHQRHIHFPHRLSSSRDPPPGRRTMKTSCSLLLAAALPLFAQAFMPAAPATGT